MEMPEERQELIMPLYRAELLVLVIDGSRSMYRRDFFDYKTGREISRGEGLMNIFNDILSRLVMSEVGNMFFISTVIFGEQATIVRAFEHGGKLYYPWAIIRQKVKQMMRKGMKIGEAIEGVLSNENLLLKHPCAILRELGIRLWTNIADGLRKARMICEAFFSDDWEILPPRERRRATVVLLTDGRPTREEANTLSMARALKEIGISSGLVEKRASVRLVVVGMGKEIALSEETKKLLYECASPLDESRDILDIWIDEHTRMRDILYRPTGDHEHRYILILGELRRKEVVEALRSFLHIVSIPRKRLI